MIFRDAAADSEAWDLAARHNPYDFNDAIQQ